MQQKIDRRAYKHCTLCYLRWKGITDINYSLNHNFDCKEIDNEEEPDTEDFGFYRVESDDEGYESA